MLNNAKTRGKKAQSIADTAATDTAIATAIATATDTAIATATDTATDTATATDTTPALSPRAIAKQAHDASGFFGRVYTGLSGTRNNDIAKAPNLSTSKAKYRSDAALTERMRATLTDLAASHAFNAFPLIGIDRGCAAIFLTSGNFIPTDAAGYVTLSNDTLSRYAKPRG